MHFMVVNGYKTIRFQSKLPFLCFGILFDAFTRHGLLIFYYKLSRVLWFVIHGVKNINYKEHRVLETTSLVTL